MARLAISALIYFLAALLTLKVAFAFDQDFSKIELKATKVQGNVYMLTGVNGFAGGNIGVSIGEDGIIMIDDQFAEMTDKIKDTLHSLNSGDLKYILNTHYHGDHVGGNASFSKQATIISHANTRKRLISDQENMFGKSPALPKKGWPVITFDQSLSVHFNDEEIKVLHYPNGHTDGDGVIYFSKSNVLHIGDYLFVDMFPFVDLDNGGNVLGYAENIKKILKHLPAGAKIIPGHGPLADRSDLEATSQMLTETIAFVQQHKNAGKDLAQIQEIGLPEKWQAWGKGFIKEDNWISFIYQSLSN